MKFEIKQNLFGYYTRLWYITAGNWRYLCKDLKIYNGVFKKGARPLREDAPGYYATKS